MIDSFSSLPTSSSDGGIDHTEAMVFLSSDNFKSSVIGKGRGDLSYRSIVWPLSYNGTWMNTLIVLPSVARYKEAGNSKRCVYPLLMSKFDKFVK